MERRLAAGQLALRLHRFFQGATWLWAGIFLVLTISLAVLMVIQPTGPFLMLSTVSTAALVLTGTGASTLWFLSVPRKLGRRLRLLSPDPDMEPLTMSAGDDSLELRPAGSNLAWRRPDLLISKVRQEERAEGHCDPDEQQVLQPPRALDVARAACGVKVRSGGRSAGGGGTGPRTLFVRSGQRAMARRWAARS